MQALRRGFLFLLIGVLGLGAVTAFGVVHAPPRSWDGRISIKESLSPSQLDSQLAALELMTPSYIHETRIRPNDTLDKVLQRLHIQDAEIRGFVKSNPTARRLLDLIPGRTLIAATDENGALQWLKYVYASSVIRSNQPFRHFRGKKGALESIDPIDQPGGELSSGLWIERTYGRLKAIERAFRNEARITTKAFEVKGSLFDAMDSAEVPDPIIDQVVRIFESTVDFHRELKRGDRVQLIYETYLQDGVSAGVGRVLAASLTINRQRNEAVWFARGNSGAYYRPDGRPINALQLRSPLPYTRISSGFSANRLHPVLGYSRAHQGVDYAAPSGTPVRAVSDSVVTIASRQGQYGNLVELRHPNGNTTRYAHLSGFAPEISVNRRVRQGQIIGFVGQTGLATGPHLHYELRINGQAVDPGHYASLGAPVFLGAPMAEFQSAAYDTLTKLKLLESVRSARAD